MTKQTPDGRLVYLHCSSIFSGTNAQIRKVKKISQMLQNHEASIKILTKEFTLPAIAAVAKNLLEQRIFESLPRARLRYPELFQPSETQEAERAASEAEVLKIEAEVAQDIVLTSDEDGENECLDFEQGEKRAEPEDTVKDRTVASEADQANGVHLWQVLSGCTLPTPQEHERISIPRLHPVYLPFKTQHDVLLLVQHLLEECCFNFGNTWVPNLMEARKWHEVESIELTQWTQRFLKYAKSLPPSAINSIAGKSTTEVLLGTNTLRHSAVHRLPTSAAGVVNMLSAAITFTEALNDFRLAKNITEIKVQLEASIEEIVQHQNLLERKLTDQLEAVARRRAQLDELERSFIEEMLAVDKKQRAEVGATIENVLVGYRQISKPCVCNCAPSLEGLKADSEAGENVKNTEIALEKAQFYDHEENVNRDEEKEENDSHSHKGKSESCAEEVREVLELIPPTARSEAESNDGNKAMLSGQVFPTATVVEAPSLDALRTSEHIAYETNRDFLQKGAWNLGATKNIIAEPRLAAVEGEFLGEEVNIKPVEEVLPKYALSSEETNSEENQVSERKFVSEETPGAPQAELAVESFNNAEEQNLNEYHNSKQYLDKHCVPPPTSDIASKYAVPAKHAEFPMSPPSGEHSQIGFDLSPSATRSFTGSPVIEATVPKAPYEEGHTIALQILNGSKILRSVVFIRSCTRTAVLNEARAYCVKCGQHGQYFGRLLAKGGDLALVSLKMNGYDMDMSTYQVEDLSSLIGVVEKTDIPTFTIWLSDN